MKSFIFFGCWNYIDLTVEIPPRDRVLQMIKKNSSDIESIIIAGDNWYPTKNTEIETQVETETKVKVKTKIKPKIKKYLNCVLESGFKLLSDINKKVYFAIGNHDIKKIPEKEPCFLLKKQLEIKNKNFIYPSINYYSSNSRRLSSDKLSIPSFLSKIEREPVIQIINGNHFLFIDTDILQDNYLDYLKKIINIIKNKNEYKIKDKDIENTKLLFIVGHDPFFVCRKKGDQKVIKTLIKTINDFIKKLKNYNVIYLCADTHNFQIGILNNTIPMIIAGTGGASLDELCFDDKNKLNTINGSDSYYYYNVKEYGYLKITPVNNINVIVLFKTLENEYTYEINLKEKSINQKTSVQVHYIMESIYSDKIKKDFDLEQNYIKC